MRKITIIGSGATGTLLAINLIKHHEGQPIEINVVEKKEKIGRGVAYSAAEDFHLLNVPAAKMGAFPDDLEHFFRWLTDKNYRFAANDFVPRRIYGEYLRELFSTFVAGRNANVVVNLLDDEAVDVLIDEAQAQVILSSGEILYSDRVVLAFGNFPPPHPKVTDQSFRRAKKYFQNPWCASLPQNIKPDEDVFIIGTGLTMADVVLSLRHAAHKGKIFALSTRGLIPAVHELGHSYPSFGDELNSQTQITDLLKIVRRHIEKAATEGKDWRGVIDSLRPHTQNIWLNLPKAEKRYFMHHLSRYWNVARHRMPPEAAKILSEMQMNNQLEILKGRLREINLGENEKFEVLYASGGTQHQVSADAFVNCIGSESNFKRIESLLVKNLLKKGYIRNDCLNLGIDATPDGKIIDESGAVSEKVFTIGTALKGVLWESTAMPEIRAQANKFALALLNGG